MIQSEIERLLIVGVTLVVACGALWAARSCRLVWIYILSGLLFVSGFSEFFAPGRELFAATPFLPGSWATRLLVVEMSGPMRRALEPTAWMLTLCLIWGGAPRVGNARIFLFAAAGILSALRSAEIALLSAFPYGEASTGLIDAGKSAYGSLAAASERTPAGGRRAERDRVRSIEG